MYTVENFSEIIKDHISKLSYDWFLQKEIKFKAHKRYDSISDIINIPVSAYEVENEYDNSSNLITSQKIDASYNIKIDLRRYCRLYFPIEEMTNWGEHPINAFDPRIENSKCDNIDEYATQLIDEIAPFLKPDSDNLNVFKFVSKVITSIETELQILSATQTHSSKYIDVLNDFHRLCAAKIHKLFQHEITSYNLTADHKSKLEFNLSQDQLMALIFIIQRAGFFKYTGNTPFLQFCFEHFLYKGEDGLMTSPSSLNNLQKKYSAVVNSQNPKSAQDISHKGLNVVEEAIKEVLKKLK